MTLTMYYIRGMHKKEEFHANIPAEDIPSAFAIFKDRHKTAIVTEIIALFTFELADEPEPSVLVTQ